MIPIVRLPSFEHRLVEDLLLINKLNLDKLKQLSDVALRLVTSNADDSEISNLAGIRHLEIKYRKLM